VAQADTAFTNFSFAAAGAPAARTMPERLSDIINVKDWGAKGNGIGDDTTAIQNAIDYCLSTAGGKQPGGKIFFPPGTYNCGSAGGLKVGHASLDVGVQLIGSGVKATIVNGPSPGFAFSKGGRTVDCLELVSDMRINGATASSSGAIQITRTGAACINLSMTGYYGIDASTCSNAYISSAFPENAGASSSNGAADATNHGFNPPGSIGIQGSDGAYISDCRVTGYDIAYTLKGSGAAMVGNTGEVNNIAVRLGWSRAGASTAYGCSVLSFQAEQTAIGVELYDCQGCYVVAFNIGQASTPCASASIGVSASWSAGQVSVTTTGGHNIGSNSTQKVLSIGIDSNWLPNNPSTYVLATVTSPTVFTYALAVNPTGHATGSVTWNYPQQYSIRLRKASECVISSFISSSTNPCHGTVDLDFGKAAPASLEDASNVQLRNVVFTDIHAGNGWVPSSGTPKNLGGIKTVNCTGSQNLNLQVTTKAMPILTFAHLPGQANVFQTGPLEGQTYSISDGSKSGFTPPMLAAFGDTVIGGGNGHYLVRHDGTNWVRIG
jgi:hypothetical protein